MASEAVSLGRGLLVWVSDLNVCSDRGHLCTRALWDSGKWSGGGHGWGQVFAGHFGGCVLMECAEVFQAVLLEHLPETALGTGRSRMLCDLRGHCLAKALLPSLEGLSRGGA